MSHKWVLIMSVHKWLRYQRIKYIQKYIKGVSFPDMMNFKVSFEHVILIIEIIYVYYSTKVYGALNIYFSGYDDKFKGVCGMLLNDHDLYEGNLKTTGKFTNCVLSFNVQGSVFTVFWITRYTVYGSGL